MNFSLKSYYDETPIIVRKISDAIKAFSAFISSSSLVSVLSSHEVAFYSKVAFGALLAGAAADALSNCFSIDKEPPNVDIK